MFLAQNIVHPKILLQDFKVHASFVYLNELYITGIHMYYWRGSIYQPFEKKNHFISSLVLLWNQRNTSNELNLSASRIWIGH